MPAKKNTSPDYETLKPAAGDAARKSDQPTLKSVGRLKKTTSENSADSNDGFHVAAKEFPSRSISEQKEVDAAEILFVSSAGDQNSENVTTNANQVKRQKTEKKAAKDKELLSSDRWIMRGGHNLTYIGLYLFSILVFYRPYEMFAPLEFLSTSAYYFALATLALYVPAQLSAEGSLTVLSTEIKCIIAMTLIALVTMPIAKDPSTAWTTFNETFFKAVLMFIVMVNVLRTRRRLMGLLWLSMSIGVYLSYTAINLYFRGEMKVEGYRVDVEVKGLFGNPNDLALHLVTMTPIAIALAFATRNKTMRLVYAVMAGLFIVANMLTFSRGGFIGLLLSSAVLAWKLGRTNRLKVSIISIVVGGLFVLLAPGNYGLRLLSIFIPSLDPVGSSDQRRELLILSIIVTLRNPWGIGIGNFPIVGIRNLVTHNAFTQVSSELGVLGLAAYLIFIISPFRKLGAIERTLFANGEKDWFYYMSIGFQASIVGYLASSFFVAVAYNWFVYYLIAYVVAFRRVYKTERGIEETATDAFGLRTV